MACCTARADSWSSAIREELRMREIITLIIQAEIMSGSLADQSMANDLKTASVQQAIQNESIKAHEAMFRQR